MVAFRAISAALAVAALTQPLGVLAGAENVDFSDNYIQPGQVRPLAKSHGYHFDHFDIIGGVLDSAGDLVEDVLATVGSILGGGKKKTSYGHPVSIVGGVNGHYKNPGRIYHESGKPFNILSLKALCCAADLSEKCDLLDCHIKLRGYDKPTGGHQIYDHDFYVPKSYNRGKKTAPIDIDVKTDGVINLGAVGIDLSALVVDIELLDLVDIDVNKGGKKHVGRYSYKPYHADGVLGLGLVVDIDLELKV